MTEPKYVTIGMIVDHVKKARPTFSVSAFNTARRLINLKEERFIGVRGPRFLVSEANRLVMRNWPESGRME